VNWDERLKHILVGRDYGRLKAAIGKFATVSAIDYKTDSAILDSTADNNDEWYQPRCHSCSGSWSSAADIFDSIPALGRLFSESMRHAAEYR